MACQWRIRHKLMLGLGLVIAVLGLLVAGTLKGLASYRSTMQSIDSKLSELHEVQNLLSALKGASESGLDDPPEEKAPESYQGKDRLAELEKKVVRARDALTAYEERLRFNIEKRRVADQGFMETRLVEALQKWFRDLDQAIDRFKREGRVEALGAQGPLADDKIHKAMTELVRAADQLHEEIYQDLYRLITASKADYKTSFGLVVATTIAGVVLMIALLRFFYRWTFNPLRDLHDGVSRVAQGNFEGRIEVHSGDEMEDLAGAFNDMTSRLHAMYADLARQVNERSRQLVRSERLASVGYLAAGVAHEINNPLASIAFCSEALEARIAGLGRGQSRPGEDDREVVSKYLKMIQQEAFRCKEITQRLLEFSRGGEKKRVATDLAELIQSVLDMVQHLQSCKGKKVCFSGGATRLVAPVSAPEIKSVVLNLVVNALESMEEGGTLTVGLRQRDGMAEMVFADTGCGMTPEVLENIFEPFFTRSRTGKGTGLGLSISHRIVNQHQGEIEAASRGQNQGSTFTVRLPLRAEEAAEESTLRLAA